MTTPEQRQQWRELEQAATPGEWVIDNTSETRSNPFAFYLFVGVNHAALAMCGSQYESRSPVANAAFIAAARAAVPALLDDVDALTTERDALKADVYKWSDQAMQSELRGDKSRDAMHDAQAERDGLAEMFVTQLAKYYRLENERDALAAELAAYKRQAAYISSVIDAEGKYMP